MIVALARNHEHYSCMVAVSGIWTEGRRRRRQNCSISATFSLDLEPRELHSSKEIDSELTGIVGVNPASAWAPG